MGKAGMLRSLLVSLAALLAASGTSIEQVDLESDLRDADFAMSAHDPPPDASPLSVVAVYQTGFYLFGVVPFCPVQLEDCVEQLAKRAKAMGADGVANMQLEYLPASFFKFVLFPIPDWSAAISLSGMSYKLPSNPAYPLRPPHPPRE